MASSNIQMQTNENSSYNLHHPKVGKGFVRSERFIPLASESSLEKWVKQASSPKEQASRQMVKESIEKCEKYGLESLLIVQLCSQTLPPDIGNLTHLKRLTIEESHLEQLPAEIGKLTKLERASFVNCQLETLPEEFGNLKNIENLSLEGNRFSNIPEAVRNLPNLEWVDLRANPLKVVPDDVKNEMTHTHFLV